MQSTAKPLSMWPWPLCAHDSFGVFGWVVFFFSPQPDDKEERKVGSTAKFSTAGPQMTPVTARHCTHTEYMAFLAVLPQCKTMNQQLMKEEKLSTASLSGLPRITEQVQCLGPVEL